jgi:hypothetical protein
VSASAGWNSYRLGESTPADTWSAPPEVESPDSIGIGRVDDGTLIGLLPARDWQEHSARRLLLLVPHAPAVVRALPLGARSVGFADARRGVAVGLNLAQLWWTRDGGVTWDRVPTALRGDPEALPLLGVSGERLDGAPRSIPIRCGRGRCGVGVQVVIRAWDDDPRPDREDCLAQEDPTYGATSLPGTEDPATEPSVQLYRVPISFGLEESDHRCVRSPTMRAWPTTWAARTPPAVGAVEAQSMTRGTGLVIVERWAGSDGVPVARVAWRAADDRGRVGLGATEGSSAIRARLADVGDVRFVAALPGGALLALCAADDPGRCALVTARAAGPLIELAAASECHPQGAPFAVEFQSMATRDGGALVLVRRRFEPAYSPRDDGFDRALGGRIVDLLLRLRPDGTVAARRDFSSTRDAPVLARHDGVAGLLLHRGHESLRSTFLAFETDEERDPLWIQVALPPFERSCGICAGAGPHSWEILSDSPGTKLYGAYGPLEPDREVIAVEHDGYCVARIQGGAERRVWLAAVRGGLTGVELGAGGTHALTCTYDPPRNTFEDF